MLDIRTVIILTVLYNFLLGVAILIYNHKKRTPHNAKFAYGLILIAAGCLLLGLRDYMPQFATVIMSNFSVVSGIMLLSDGMKIYTKSKKNILLKDILILSCFLASFLYFTYLAPNINMRIIIIASTQIIYFAEITHTLLNQQEKIIKKESGIVSVFFVVAILVQVARVLLTIYELPMTNFMSAGLIHSIAIIVYQLLPINLALGIFLMDNTVIKHQLETQAMTDGLTELYNRVAFLKIVTSQCKRTQRTKDSLALVMCDVDFFKEVNDTYGHQGGDLVLQQLPKIFHEHIRGSDVIGRYGGDEFIIALMDINQTALEAILEKIRLTIEKAEFNFNGKVIKVTMSFGAILVDENFDLSAAIERADQALYQSKRGSRNCIHFL